MLTNENYFSTDNQMKYMSHSQFLAFQRCEAAALAEARGEYISIVSSTALLVGGYVDAFFSGEMPIYLAKHPEMFKRDGSLKADFVKANDVINRMLADDLYCRLLDGRKQQIMTGTIAGVPFKIKIDSLLSGSQCRDIVDAYPETANVFGFCDGAIVDQKCMRDLEPVWDEEARAKVSFVEKWGYDIQGAIYQAVEGHMLPFILAVGTKEDEPDLQALTISDADLQAALHVVEDSAPRFQAIKEGKIPPRSCGRCPYCRARKKLTRIINYKELDYGFEN